MSKKSRDQRKRKRVQKLTQAQTQNVDSDKVIKSESHKKARIEALNYLAMFARHQAKLSAGEQSELWKFNKTRQVWLLKNCYSLEKLPPKHFKIFLKYIKTIHGEQAKNRILSEAQQLVEARSQTGEIDESRVKLDSIEISLIAEQVQKDKALGEELKQRIIANKLKRAGKVADLLS